MWLDPKTKAREVPEVKMQKQKFKWKKTADEDQEIKKAEKGATGKPIDKTVHFV